MKKMMKFLAALIISAALLVSPVYALADEGTVTVADTEMAEETREAEHYNEADADKADGAIEEILGAENEENGFEKIYDAAMAHVSEILSLAAFIGSMICAVIYKSGLMPLMEKGLGGIKNAAQKIKEATDRAECDSKASLGYINDKMNELEIAISEMQETVKAATAAMESAVDMKAHQARIDGLLAGELDMLYDIFMSSALPEYEKTRVGERVAKLKEGLNSDEHEK